MLPTTIQVIRVSPEHIHLGPSDEAHRHKDKLGPDRPTNRAQRTNPPTLSALFHTAERRSIRDERDHCETGQAFHDLTPTRGRKTILRLRRPSLTATRNLLDKLSSTKRHRNHLRTVSCKRLHRLDTQAGSVGGAPYTNTRMPQPNLARRAMPPLPLGRTERHE